jgi:hypothetical protein
MENDMEYEEMRDAIYGLAEEIISMTEEEKLFSLKKIVQTELKGNENRFWTSISKKMLVNPELPGKILSQGMLAQAS